MERDWQGFEKARHRRRNEIERRSNSTHLSWRWQHVAAAPRERAGRGCCRWWVSKQAKRRFEGRMEGNGWTAHSTCPLPEGWWSYVDPRTGVPYYYNARTGQTQWEWPREGDPKARGASSQAQDAKRKRVLRDPHRSTSVVEREPTTLRKSNATWEHGRTSRRAKDKTTKRSVHDPMDPSSYSDAPQGGWSRGLNANLP